VAQHITEIEQKNNTMEIVMRNHKALFFELQDLLVCAFLYFQYFFLFFLNVAVDNDIFF
jgi:predicted ribosome-associated RNA-binding protein Tma20